MAKPAKIYTNRDSSTYLLLCTTRIIVHLEDGTAFGTGFFYQHGDPSQHFLMTNKHVIEGGVAATFVMHRTQRTADNVGQFVWLDGVQTIKTPVTDWVLHPDPEVDLALLPFGAFSHQTPADAFCTYVTNTFAWHPDSLMRFYAAHPVMMYGYPNGLWDDTYSLPVVRYGSTASHPGIPFNGRDQLVDIGCFPGSSGSPVFLRDRDYAASVPCLLGALCAGPTFDGFRTEKRPPAIDSGRTGPDDAFGLLG